ncbi:hypothetical protein PV02_06975 [Methanolobus chelungpuianus]|uniref:DUF1722 domain-containing protein n=2 Tax=Methanolobus chelungpuianus TaxID=502115 RepID=A0AAE3L1R9_9EURY|nr:hypothetical protein [Methanolobus chelungpuianus]
MHSSPRPRILISKCLGFSPCRYDGSMVPFPVAEAMGVYVDFIAVCPEYEIGLGVPRAPIRIILGDQDARRLVQPATGLDITERMADFTSAYLDRLDTIDGAILKSRSPSCGIGNTKIFSSSASKDCLHRKGTGFFAEGLKLHFPSLPTVDEEQLYDPAIRDDFLARVFALASFREAAGSGKMSELLDYHTRNKLLLMAFDKKAMKWMGDLAANHGKRPLDDVLKDYGRSIREVLSREAGIGSNINVLMHAIGYFSDRLTGDEKLLFEGMISKYRRDSTVLAELRQLLLSWIMRSNVEYLAQQTYFSPYPPELSGTLRQV